MTSHDILDDFSHEKGQVPTMLQRVIRLIEVSSWIVFFLSFDHFMPAQGPFYFSLTALLVLYVLLPAQIFQSHGLFKNLVSHFTGLLMIPFLLGFLFQLEQVTMGRNLHTLAGFCGLAGIFMLIYFMIKSQNRLTDYWFWLNMIIRLLLVVAYTANNLLYFFFSTLL